MWSGAAVRQQEEEGKGVRGRASWPQPAGQNPTFGGKFWYKGACVAVSCERESALSSSSSHFGCTMLANASVEPPNHDQLVASVIN